MARRRITDDDYTAMMNAFREKPGVYENAARKAGVDRKTATRGWLKGWPRLGMPPIRDAITEEQTRARQQLEVEQAAKTAMDQKEREEARAQAVKARKEEGQMVIFTRGQSLQNLTVAVQLAQAARELMPVLKEACEVQAAKMKAWNEYEKDVLGGSQSTKPTFAKPPMSIEATSMLLARVAETNARIVNTARQAMEMERLYLGQPTDIIGFVDETREVTLEELDIRKRAADKAVSDALKLGGFKPELIEGGLSDSNSEKDGQDHIKIGERVRLV